MVWKSFLFFFFFHAIKTVTAQRGQKKVVQQGLFSTELQLKDSPSALYI